MTQEDKELLLQDLCSRLPYGVKINCNEDIIMTLRQIDENCFCECWENKDFKCYSRWMLPYLRPLSSMSEEELNKFEELEWEGDFEFLSLPLLDWLNEKMFDYRGLIEKGLALEAPEGMYEK